MMSGLWAVWDETRNTGHFQLLLLRLWSTLQRLMKYLLAIICPPLAVLMCGRPMQAMINLLLTLCLWVPGMVHAFFIVNSAMADEKAGSTLHVMRKHQLNSVLHKM